MIISGLNMEIKNKEIMGLLGANGSGKTTLINIITGNIHPNMTENGSSLVIKDEDGEGIEIKKNLKRFKSLIRFCP
jgi:ABC-type multidrug transport system ATPase subunit